MLCGVYYCKVIVGGNQVRIGWGYPLLLGDNPQYWLGANPHYETGRSGRIRTRDRRFWSLVPL